jgi:hypothetical protein
LRGTHRSLDLGKTLLDRIQIRAVGGRNHSRAPAARMGYTEPGVLVGAEIIDYDDVTAAKLVILANALIKANRKWEPRPA